MMSLRAVIISGVVFAVIGCSTGLHYTYPTPGDPGPVLELGTVQDLQETKPEAVTKVSSPLQANPVTNQEIPQSAGAATGTSALPSDGHPSNVAGDSDVQPSGPPRPHKDLRPQVRTWIDRLTGRDRETFEGQLERFEKIRPTIERIFRENGIPEELSYLCIVESGARPDAMSPSGAGGYWQFMPDTARRFGLQVNRYVDERKNLEKSTAAAARYLDHLYSMFGDWYLAIAAYNAGEGAVMRLVETNGVRSFWDIQEGMPIKYETIGFVPKFIATVIVSSDRIRYGLPAPDAPLNHALGIAAAGYIPGFSTKEGAGRTRLAEASPLTMTDAPLSVRREYDRSGADPDRQARPGSKGAPRAAAARHKVKPGDTLYSIALRHDTTVRAIEKANGLKPGKKIRPGMVLSIPAGRPGQSGTAERGVKVQQNSADISGKPLPSKKGGGTLKYEVKKGDTLWSVARRFDVSPSEIAQWNRIGIDDPIRPGDLLKIRSH